MTVASHIELNEWVKFNLCMRKNFFYFDVSMFLEHLIDHLIATYNMVQGFSARDETVIVKISFSLSSLLLVFFFLLGKEAKFFLLFLDLRFGASKMSHIVVDGWEREKGNNERKMRQFFFSFQQTLLSAFCNRKIHTFYYNQIHDFIRCLKDSN